MSNGDRLSGTLVTMTEGTVILETEYAGETAVEWAAVREVTLDRPLPAVVEDGSEMEIRRLPADGVRLADVVAIAPPALPPPQAPTWKGRVDFGYAQTGGNRNSSLGTLTAFAARAGAPGARLSLFLDTAQGATEGEETANRARLQGRHDQGSSDLSYRYYLANIGYDRVRDSDRRVELGYGIGRPLIDKPRNLLTAEVGLAYVTEAFGTGESESNAKLRLGESWRRQLGADAELLESLALLSTLGDLGDLTSEFVLAVRQSLTSRLAFTTRFVNTYDSRPVAGTERSDYTVTAQIGFAFGD
jgi:putative salt-induced outer membrane protein YdiY